MKGRSQKKRTVTHSSDPRRVQRVAQRLGHRQATATEVRLNEIPLHQI